MGDSGLYQEVRNVTVTGIIESVHLLHLPSKDSWPYCACGILDPWPGIEPGPLAVKVPRGNSLETFCPLWLLITFSVIDNYILIFFYEYIRLIYDKNLSLKSKELFQ